MWAVALESPKTFEKIFTLLRKVVPYELTTSGTGASIAVAPLNQDPSHKHPHFFLMDPNVELSKHAISWVHKNLHPQVIISSGLTDDWREFFPENSAEKLAAHSSENSTEERSMIPQVCLRSAGRIDMGGGPILYEEIPFDPWVQSSLSKLILPSPSISAMNLANPLSKTLLKVFGSDREITKEAEKQWLASNLSCHTYDTFSGELLLAGKRLGLRIGCIKFYNSNPKAMQSIVDFWTQFTIPV